MYIYLNKNGVLKEIISEKQFRSGDSKRDKLYIYYENEKAVSSAWIKYIKADGTQTIETQFYDETTNELLGKELPTEPVRNLEFFNYNHTYTDISGYNHIGYEFLVATIPDDVLASATTDSKLCSAIIRFVFTDGTEETLDQAGIIPFSVEGTTVGVKTDNSINETQYNYLIKNAATSDVVANPSGLLDDTLSSIRIKGVNYGIVGGGGGGEPDAYLKTATKSTSGNYETLTITGKNFATDVNITAYGRPTNYVKEAKINLKELLITNVTGATETQIGYGAGTSEFALQSALNTEITNRKNEDNKKVDKESGDGTVGFNYVKNASGIASVEGKTPANETNKVEVSGTSDLVKLMSVDGTGTGSRVFVKSNKAYYTKGKDNDTYAESDEIATKGDIVGGFQKKFTAGDNITIDETDVDHPKISSNQIKDDATTTTDKEKKTYSIKKSNELLDNKTDKKIIGTNGKSLMFNENDGGGAKFEGNSGVNSYIGVHDGSGNGIKAQIYAVKTDNTQGTIIDVKEDKIYYYKGAVVGASSRDVANNEIARILDVETEKTRATTKETELNTAIATEKTRAETKETELEGKFADYYKKRTGATGEDQSKVTYNAQEIKNFIDAKANDFDIDTTTLEWDTSGTKRKLKTKFGDIVQLKGQVAALSDLPTADATRVGHLYLVGSSSDPKRDLYICCPKGTTPETYDWFKAGDTSIDLTLYQTKAVTVGGTATNVSDALNDLNDNKQDTLVSQTNIASIGSSVGTQKSLLSYSTLNIKVNGGWIGAGATIHIKIVCVGCTYNGTTLYEEDLPKDILSPGIVYRATADSGKAFASTGVEVKLDGTDMVAYTDYQPWASSTIFEVTMNQAGIDKMQLAGANELVITFTAN